MATAFDVNKTSILVSDTVAKDPLKIKQAFAQIIANNTGERIIDVLENPAFNEISISNGIKRSYFEKIDSQYLTDNRFPKFWYHVVADEKVVQSIIQQAGFSILPHNREKVLLWLVKEEEVATLIDPSGLETENESNILVPPILSYGYDDELSMYWLNRWAQALGVNLEIPTMDGLDTLAVPPESIQLLSYEAYQQTRNRYDLNYGLLVFIKRAEDIIKVRSGFAVNQKDMFIKYFQEQMINEEPVEEGELLYSVILDVVEQYSNIFKIDKEDLEKHMVRIVVDNFDNFDQVRQVSEYLNNKSVIESIEIISAELGTVELNVDLSVTTAAFLKIVTHEGFLIYNHSSPINQLIFSLIKSEQ